MAEFGSADAGSVTALHLLRARTPLPPGGGSWLHRADVTVGNLAALQWFRIVGPPFPWDTWASHMAVEGGHVNALEWLRAQDPPCPWNEWTCSAAAENGHLATLQWLRAQDPPCPWDARTCTAAVAGGRLDMLQWLRSQRAPIDFKACLSAAHEGGPCRAYLELHGPTWAVDLPPGYLVKPATRSG